MPRPGGGLFRADRSPETCYDNGVFTIDDAFIDRCFETSAPRDRRPLAFYFAIGLGLAFLFIPALSGRDFGLPRTATVIVPLAFAAGVLGGVARATKRQRQQSREACRAWESIQLEDWDGAERELATAFDRPIASSTARCQALLALARLAERRRNFDAAIGIYQRLLIEQIGEPMQLQRAQISLVQAKFRNEELTDGIQMLERLEKFSLPLPLQAGIALVRLYQHVFMGQFEDAVGNLDELKPLLRRFLSTRAGYGYALVARALHQLGRTEEAAAYWLDATTLIQPARIVEAYPVVHPVDETYPAMEVPQ